MAVHDGCQENASYDGVPVGVQDTDPLSEGTERVTGEDLLLAAGDPTLTARRLEFWRHQGLLPKAQRTGQHGKHPQWSYPPEALDQLAALQHLRTKTKDPDLLRTALWFEGFPIDTRRVGTSIAAVLDRHLKAILKEVDKRRVPGLAPEEANWAALEQIGRLLARRRGPKALPRFGRQRSEERERAMALALGLALGDEATAARLEDDGGQLERMLGVDRGRRSRAGLPAWLEGPPGDGLEVFANFGSLPALIGAVKDATEEELMASRRLARIVLDGVTAVTRIATAVVGVDNPVGFGGLAYFRDDPVTVSWLLAFLVGVGRSSMLSENLRTVVDSLSQNVLPIDARARELARLSEDELRNRFPDLEGLPFIEQVRLKSLIAEYRSEAHH